jgi:tripeptidyl-peptidase-2
VRACDEVVHAAAGGDLARLLGERADLENEEAKAARERAEKRRDALVEALRRKVEALAEDPGADAEIAAAYAEVARWTDPAKGDAAVVAVEHERRRGRPAKALEILNARIEEAAPERALFEQRLRLLEALGWTCWVERERRGLMVRFPESYPPF